MAFRMEGLSLSEGLIWKIMINTSTRLKQFKSLIKAEDYINAIKSGLEFLRYVGNEYERLEIYNDQNYDSEDFDTREVERLLADVLRKEELSADAVRSAREELDAIRKMAAYENYGLSFFEHIDEAICYRLSDAATYLADLGRRIKLLSRDYRRIMQDKEEYRAANMSLYRFEELEDALQKKIVYLREHGRNDEAEKVVQDFWHVPAIRSLIINERLEAGDDDGAFLAIDEGISIYLDDGYSNTADWHKLKIGILERRNDRDGVIDEYRRLFRQFLSDKETYYMKLKELVPKDEWKDFSTKLFSDIPSVSDEECVLVCDMIVEENLYGCLAGILMKNRTSFQRSEIFAKYARYMDEEGQARFIGMVMEELRQRLTYVKSKSYGYIADEIKTLYASCPTGKRMMSDFVGEIAAKYGNRPALMRKLGC